MPNSGLVDTLAALLLANAVVRLVVAMGSGVFVPLASPPDGG
jgi:hypothetical protein